MKKLFITTLLCCLLLGVLFFSFSDLLLTSTVRDSSSKIAIDSNHPNVLLIVVDTLPAYQLGAYTPGLKNSPNIDALAEEGVRFTEVRSVSSWTKPSIASIFTGVMPSTHGVLSIKDKLSESSLTLAEELQHFGYMTAGFVSHTILGAKSGYGQGFDTYEQLNQGKNVHETITSEIVVSRAVEWLQKKEGEQPFFLYLHFFDPHFRYHEYKEFDFADHYGGKLKSNMSLSSLMRKKDGFSKDDIEYLRTLQQEEIAYTDRQIGRLLNELSDLKLREDTMIIFTADHGEEFMEHNSLGHTSTLYEEVVRLPLIVSFGRAISSRIDTTPMSLIDIMPTIMDLCCEKLRSTWEGESVAESLLSGVPVSFDRNIFMEVSYRQVAKSHIVDPNKLAVVSDSWKLIFDLNQRQLELYNLKTDPSEQEDLADSRFDIVQKLRPLLHSLEEKNQQVLSTFKIEAEEKLPLEQVDSLRSLGYL